MTAVQGLQFLRTAKTRFTQITAMDEHKAMQALIAAQQWRLNYLEDLFKLGIDSPQVVWGCIDCKRVQTAPYPTTGMWGAVCSNCSRGLCRDCRQACKACLYIRVGNCVTQVCKACSHIMVNDFCRTCLNH